MLLGKYEIPPVALREPISGAFWQFFHHWFVDSFGLTRGDVDISFLGQLTPAETEVARNLLRRNLGLKYDHIIEGVAALGDVASVPTLRAMLDVEHDNSRQLTIAGVLWILAGDESFVGLLNRGIRARDLHVRRALARYAVWLGDERAIDMLVDLVNDFDDTARSQALRLLNTLEAGQHVMEATADLPHRATDYLNRRYDAALRALMAENLRKIRWDIPTRARDFTPR
jgi:hypothetical protein